MSRFGIAILFTLLAFASFPTSAQYEEHKLLHTRGAVEVALKNYEKALPYFEQIIKLGSNKIGAFDLAKAYVNAAFCLTQLRAKTTGFASVLGNEVTTEHYLREAIRIDPKYYASYIALANFHDEKGLYDKSISVLKKAVELLPKNFRIHERIGLWHFRAKNYQASVSALEKSISFAPKTPSPYYTLGLGYRHLKRYDDAIRSLEKAVVVGLEIGLEIREVNYELGNLYTIKQRPDVALRHYKEAVRVEPDYPNAYNALGDTYNDLRMYPEAIDAFNRSIKLDKLSAIPHVGLGNSYYLAGKDAESISHYKKAIDLKSRSAAMHVYLGSAYARTKQYDLAIASLNAAVAIDVKFAESYYWLGLVYIERKNLPMARAQHDKLALLDKSLAESLLEKIKSASPQ